ncbi:MAG: hypothetical protein AAF541_24020 [Pseudomonadota bacterium]
MSFIVVIGVVLLAYVYIKSNRQARTTWLKKVSLPGRWVLENAEDESQQLGASEHSAIFSGNTSSGSFRSQGVFEFSHGLWEIQGHTLILNPAGRPDFLELELHLFKPGQIGLEFGNGRRLLLSKQADNVVTLRPNNKPGAR